MSCITLRSCSCDIIVLNVHVQTEAKSGDAKDSICRELEHVHYQKEPCENSLRKFQCKSKERRYFQTNKWELEFT